MKSFSTFLFESTFNPNSWGGFTNRVKIGEHEVHTDFSPTYTNNQRDQDGKYSVAFMVNRNLNVGRVQDPHVFRHVRNLVHQFIAEKKPKSLVFDASDDDPDQRDKKATVYQQFAQSLAKKYGATYDSYRPDKFLPDQAHRVTFKK